MFYSGVRSRDAELYQAGEISPPSNTDAHRGAPPGEVKKDNAPRVSAFAREADGYRQIPLQCLRHLHCDFIQMIPISGSISLK